MLAKIWKKLLLAICIIACIYNVTYKLVNRHSLKLNLESVNDGTTIFGNLFDTEETSINSSSDTIEGVVAEEEQQEPVKEEVEENTSKSVSKYTENGVEHVEEEQATEEQTEEKSSSKVKFINLF